MFMPMGAYNFGVVHILAMMHASAIMLHEWHFHALAMMLGTAVV